MATARNTCLADDCNRPIIARGLCTLHYQRMKKRGSIDPRPNPNEKRTRFLLTLPETDECIIWPFCASKTSRYGLANYGGKQTSAHRVSLILHKGPPPTDAHHAAHDPVNCTSPLCVNPRHLRWATPMENSDDKVVKGTVSRGSAHSKLTNDQVVEIANSTEFYTDIARKYGVCSETVLRIRRGATWGWLTGRSCPPRK